MILICEFDSHFVTSDVLRAEKHLKIYFSPPMYNFRADLFHKFINKYRNISRYNLSSIPFIANLLSWKLVKYLDTFLD